MLLAPPAFPLSFLVGLLSLALLGGGLYTLWGWYTGALVGTAYLAGGLLTAFWSIAGRWVALLLLGRGDPDGPTEERTGGAVSLPRPDGTVLRVERYGLANGPTVVLTHGWGTDSTEWYYAKRSLGTRFRVLVWDMRGLGNSTRSPSNDYRVSTLAADLDAVVALAAGDAPVILVGHSLGGVSSLALCRHFPECLAPAGQVAGLVLVNSTYTSPLATTTASGFFSAVRKPVLEPLLLLTIWLWPVMWLSAWLSYLNGTAHLLSWLTGFAGRPPRRQLDFTTRLGAKAHPAVLARGMLAAFRCDETAALAAVKVPALVITGEGDRVLVPQASARISAALPQAQLLSLADARHQALLQRHESFDAAVLSFASGCLETPTSARAA
ncbi:MAG TPA: alpha/beta hydrolase [Chloroflexota bacterium]|nr:alpha/beta hydrolase [Chloroflexota bacterium]